MIKQVEKKELNKEILELRSELNQYENNFQTANLRSQIIELSRTLDKKIIAYQRLNKKEG